MMTGNSLVSLVTTILPFWLHSPLHTPVLPTPSWSSNQEKPPSLHTHMSLLSENHTLLLKSSFPSHLIFPCCIVATRSKVGARNIIDFSLLLDFTERQIQLKAQDWSFHLQISIAETKRGFSLLHSIPFSFWRSCPQICIAASVSPFKLYCDLKFRFIWHKKLYPFVIFSVWCKKVQNLCALGCFHDCGGKCVWIDGREGNLCAKRCNKYSLHKLASESIFQDSSLSTTICCIRGGEAFSHRQQTYGERWRGVFLCDIFGK